MLKRFDKDNYKSIPNDENVALVPCKNDFYTITIMKDGVKRFIHSKYDPVKEARNQVASFVSEAQDKRLILVFGLGMGYHLYEILKHMPTEGKVYVFEPCPYSLKLFLENGGESLLNDKRLNFFSIDEKTAKKAANKALNMDNCETLAFFAHPIYSNIFHETHDSLVRSINADVNNLLVQKNTIRYFGKEWTVNYFSNYKFLAESAAVKNLFGLFKDRTAVVVAAGPSLSKNVEQLKRVGERAVIICVDTAYSELVYNGIKPHLLVSVSGGKYARNKLAGISYNTPLVYKGQTQTHIVEGHTGIKFYAASENNFLEDMLLELHLEAGRIESGGSVTCSALDLAVKLGVKNVIFTGLDLALTDGRSHGEKTTGWVTDFDRKYFTIKVDDIYGGKIDTLRNYNYYRLWIEEYIRNNEKVRFIDATEGGALIKGAEIMSLKCALNGISEEPFEIEKEIERAHTKFLTKDDSKIILGVYKSAYDDYLKAKDMVVDMIAVYSKGERITHNQVDAALKKINSLVYAVRYSVLAYFYQLENMIIGKRPSEEQKVFCALYDALEELQELFNIILEEK